jgi:dTDP-4-amino-4,6-dideoxygalactose transaminase
MVSTNSSKIAGLLESVKSHGRKPQSLYFDHIRFGLNFKMNDLEASIGLSQIPEFWNIFNKRKENLYYLLNKIKDLEKFAYFNLEERHEVVCPHAFTITLKDPKYNLRALYKHLEDNSIKCKRNFGSMPTQHKAFEFLGYKLGDFPEAEYVGDNGLHFGIHQYLNKDDLDYISEKLHEYFSKFK